MSERGAPVDAATARASLSFNCPQQVEVLKAKREWERKVGGEKVRKERERERKSRSAAAATASIGC